tara:strand:+ start:30253 stop:30936 length:684 start_codon:yes stop_codon:yes gene_type:complete
MQLAFSFIADRPLKVLIACECSGTVRRAFEALGHDAWSCDIKPAEDRSNRHITGDVREYLTPEWDLLAVMHPPCTRLCNSGVRWLTTPPPGRTLADMWAELDEGAALFSDCWNAPIDRIAVENPVMHKHAKERIRNYQPFAQSVQPWQFATDKAGPDNEKKRTCFWLKGLPPLKPTGALDGSTARDSVHKASPGAQRATERSRFFPGMATAMAAQWGGYALDVARAA